MKKYYLFFIFFTALSMTAAAHDAAPEFCEELPEQSEWMFDAVTPDVEEELTPISITANGTQVHITNAAGKTLEIYNLAGVRVGTFKIDSDDTTLNINLSKGCYILKVDKVVRKVSIK